jgi:putative hydrolase of the HAD superfamily
VTLSRQTLLFDADDTLWENNIYFERAIAAFISFLDHRVHSPEQVREHLNACEHATIAAHGYGLSSFRLSLVTCFEQLAETPLTAEVHAKIHSFAEIISTSEIELLPSVAETLKQLHGRHRLILVTKGDTAEQTDKLVRSGLSGLFSAVEVLAEKNVAAYLDVLRRYDLTPGETWMIGNSPKSDINPSLAAGLNAVFIPHDHTWELEHEVLDATPEGQQLLTLHGFADLLGVF